jgi:hypothetical protein
MRPLLLLAALPLSLAACQQETAPAPEASETAVAAGPDAAPVPTSPSPVPTPTAAETSGTPEGGIPVALQGNWGMVPADCTSTRGDAKGLLRISPTALTFYESVGKLGTTKNRSDTRLRADFAFSGEGMTWTRDVELSVAGNKLTRTERGGEEPSGPFTYTKCAT